MTKYKALLCCDDITNAFCRRIIHIDKECNYIETETYGDLIIRENKVYLVTSLEEKEIKYCPFCGQIIKVSHA